jgi:hypothetical protein
MDWNTVTAADVQTALREITGLEGVTVSGDTTDGMDVAMYGIQSPLQLVSSPPPGGVIDVSYGVGVPFSPLIARGDKLIDSSKHLTVKEVIEIPDLGGEIMGYRVRVE